MEKCADGVSSQSELVLRWRYEARLKKHLNYNPKKKDNPQKHCTCNCERERNCKNLRSYRSTFALLCYGDVRNLIRESIGRTRELLVVSGFLDEGVGVRDSSHARLRFFYCASTSGSIAEWGTAVNNQPAKNYVTTGVGPIKSRRRSVASGRSRARHGSIVQSDWLWSSRMLSPTKKKTKMFHASMKVTRLEEWCVEAETLDQARALLESGTGHRLCIGECLDVELEQLLED